MEDGTVSEIVEIGNEIFELRFERSEEFAVLDLIAMLEDRVSRQELLLKKLLDRTVKVLASFCGIEFVAAGFAI